MLSLLQSRTIFENGVLYISESSPSSSSTSSSRVRDILDNVSGSASKTEEDALDGFLAAAGELSNHRTDIGKAVLMSVRMMSADRVRSPVLYVAAKQLLHGVHICDIYEGIESIKGIECPDIIARWYNMVVVPVGKSSGTLLDRLRLLRDDVHQIRADVCYPYLRDRIDADLHVLRDEMTSELSMSYHVLEEAEVVEILTLLEVPEGLKSMILECTWHETPENTSAQFLYVSIGLALLILIGVVCFYRFKWRTRVVFHTRGSTSK